MSRGHDEASEQSVKKLNETQRRTLDGALILAGYKNILIRGEIINDLEPVLADMLFMEYERGHMDGREWAAG